MPRHFFAWLSPEGQERGCHPHVWFRLRLSLARWDYLGYNQEKIARQITQENDDIRGIIRFRFVKEQVDLC